MTRREFFRFLPVSPVVLVAGPKPTLPPERHGDDLITRDDWNQMVRAVRDLHGEKG